MEGYKISYRYADDRLQKEVTETLIFVGSFYEAATFVSKYVGSLTVYKLTIQSIPIYTNK